MIWIIIIVIMGISFFASYRLKSKFSKYSQVALHSRLSGKEIAEKMLAEHNIYDVKVISTDGFLTDHYNPANKTINLSAEVFHGMSVSAAAVAAHECGHAVQHADAYAWLGMRSKLVPAVSIASRYMSILLIAGVFTITVFPYLLLAGIVLFASTTLFSFITLPVEFDASSRALAWLNRSKITQGEEHEMAKDALKWAASTYVIAAISSLVTLLYYVSIFLGRRD